MQKRVYVKKLLSIPDLAILLLVATIIYGIVSIGNEWRTEFRPIIQIDLSLYALPYYTLLSGIRGIVAYLISLAFTLVVGYAAARSRFAEKIIIPLLDILQSIPVLGFLPGLLLGLVALFPKTNIGLELAAIIMIFTGQVWNMTFSFYSSLKSTPSDLNEASTVMNFSRWEKLLKLELPFSAVNLAWNSLLSMAGGWFFLIPCEAMTLGDQEYRLPGIGAYMDVAIKKGDNRAITFAVFAMIGLTVLMDFALWRPILAWVQRFRMEESAGAGPTEPLMQIWIRESSILRQIKLGYHHWVLNRLKHRTGALKSSAKIHVQEWKWIKIPRFLRAIEACGQRLRSPILFRMVQLVGVGAGAALVAYGGYKLFLVLSKLSLATWIVLLRNTLWTLCRVFAVLFLSSLWAVPVGIWVGTSSRRVRIAQPIIQVLASFPAPMLYPLVLGLFFAMGISFDWASMFLMLLGVQWYVVFNVLAGALRLPKELNDALDLMEVSIWDRWKRLYLPSVFPSLVTGWVTAAGGAWNASVLAEYIYYRGKILKTGGLGATLSTAIANEDFVLFAGSLTLMVLVVVLLNRLVWSRLYNLVQTRYRLEA